MGDLIRMDTRGARKKAKMTQYQWADAIPCTIDNVRRMDYKNGLPSWPTALRMAQIVGRVEIEGYGQRFALVREDDRRDPPPASPMAKAA